MHFHGPATDTDKNITDSETPKLQTLCVKEKEKVSDEDIPHFESYADNDQNRTQKDWNMYLSRFNWRLLHSHIVWQPGCIDKTVKFLHRQAHNIVA